jgi:hypothetical protein
MKETVVERLQEAGLGIERFIDCQDGQKSTVDHTQYPPEEVSGNYGIYAEARDRLVILDVDDYDDIDDESGLDAIAELPATFKQESPHRGRHKPYAVEISADGRFPAAVLADEFGSANLKPSWGEARVANQYVVGAGSQLDGCDKEWCDDCAAEDGGQYTIAADRPIATISADELIQALEADPKIERDTGTDPADDSTPDVDADEEEILEHALECDDKLRRLWNGDYSDYGGDRSEAECALAYKLAFWFAGDKATVRRMMDQARPEKWVSEDRESYRESVLSAVDKQTEYYEPSEHPSHSDPAEFDPEEVERGEAILNAQTDHKKPASPLREKNGCYQVWRSGRGDDDGQWRTITNFTLETVSYLDTYEGELLNIRVHPQKPIEEPYTVQVEPKVFNEPSTFKSEVVTGRTTTFDTGGASAQTILNALRETVGSQPAPRREGVEHIGLAGKEFDEWVTPQGTLTEAGWCDDPDRVHYTKGGDGGEEASLADKWLLEPDGGADFDADEVADIIELISNAREPDRGLPALAWFYAAPLKTHIHQWEGEFNLLQVTGQSGSGKTAMLESLWQMFGMTPNPFSVSSTPFTKERQMAMSCGVPVWYDEYKPATVEDYKLDHLHNRLRSITKETPITKGQADLGEITFHIRAPVVISGEQQFGHNVVAVRRRAVMTNFTKAATEDGTQTAEAFGELAGVSYEDADGEEHYPEGKDLKQHAIAYYQWVCGQEGEKLHAWWRAARERCAEILGDLGISVDGSEFQGLQTIVFGQRVLKEFALAHDADTEQLPTGADLRAAIDHVAENIGHDGRRREHADELLELLSQSAASGYIENDIEYRIVEPRKFDPQEALAIHMPSAFNAVKKYARDYNVEDEYTILGKSDYVDAYGNKADVDGTYILDVNRKVRGLENGSKAVYINPDVAEEQLGDGFNLAAFRPEEDEPLEDNEALSQTATPIGALGNQDNPYYNVTAQVVNYERGSENGPAVQATLSDESGHVDLVDWQGSDAASEIEEGSCYLFKSIKLGHKHNLEPTDGATEVVDIEPGTGNLPSPDTDGDQASLESSTATDGGTVGQEFEQLKPNICGAFERPGQRLSTEAIAAEVEADEDDVFGWLTDVGVPQGYIEMGGSDDDGWKLLRYPGGGS